jgi:hypothetical protein
MNGACVSGEYTCPCEKDSDCDDSNPCTEESCVDAVCEYSDKEGLCNDGKDCTRNDYCEGGVCVSGEGACGGVETGAECDASWQCGLWSACVDNKQRRSCTCGCPKSACSGDHDSERSCVSELQNLQVLTGQGLSVGDILTIRITDEDGNPITGRIMLIRPDGTSVEVQGDTYVVDQAGIWKIVVEKEGYQPAETETSVVDKAPPAADLGSQISNAVKEVVEFITKEPVRFALLLTTITLVIGGLFFLKTRKKSGVEKL